MLTATEAGLSPRRAFVLSGPRLLPHHHPCSSPGEDSARGPHPSLGCYGSYHSSALRISPLLRDLVTWALSHTEAASYCTREDLDCCWFHG